MKRATSIVCMLLLAMTISCNETDTGNKTDDDIGDVLWNSGRARRSDEERRGGNDAQRQEHLDIAAKAAWKEARENYRKNQKYAEAEKQFATLRKNHPQSHYFAPSEVYIHMCRAHLAVKARQWGRAQTEEDTAASLTRTIQKNSVVDSPIYKWTGDMNVSIGNFKDYRLSRKAFAEVMDTAMAHYKNHKYADATGVIDARYRNGTGLDEEQRAEVAAFKRKVVRADSLGKCTKLMDAARKAHSAGDPANALAAWDSASSGLQQHDKNLDRDWSRRMKAEVNKAREKLSKALGVREVMKRVAAARDEARDTGDKGRLLRILQDSMQEPGVSTQLVASWGAEVKKIQEEMDFDKIKKLLVEGKDVEVMDLLTKFIEKYPENRRAVIILEGLKKKGALAALKQQAIGLYDLGRWKEALPLLEKLRRQDRGNRDLREKVRDCNYNLVLIDFKAAVAAGDFAKATELGNKAREIYSDGYDRDIASTLATMEAKQRILATLAKGRKALEAGQFKDARNIVKGLTDSYKEAQDITRRSKFLENKAKGDNARTSGDIKTAWATYKIAKRHAETPEEHKQIDALISATAPSGD